jgi:hypothetical protein
MGMSAEVLERLLGELNAIQDKAAAREANLNALLAQTREQERKWAADWQHTSELLELRRGVLEATANKPDALISAAQENLDETEEGLRSFLRAVQDLADHIDQPQPEP